MVHPIPFPGKGRGGAEPSSRDVTLAMIPRIARICALGLGLDELLVEACREVLYLSGAEEGCLVSLRDDPAREQLIRFCLPGEWPDFGDAYRPGPARERVLDRLRAEGILEAGDVGKLSPDHPLRVLYAPRSVKSALLLPLKFGTHLLGLLALHVHGVARPWGEEESRALAKVVAPVLSAALERRRIEERLRASEARYRFLADSALDFISVQDPSGKFVYASPAARPMLGYRPEEMVTAPMAAFLHPDDHGRFLEENRRLAEGEIQAVTLQHRLRRKDGSFAEVETVSSAVPDSRGKVGQILRVTRDISERKEMERRLFESRKQETIGMLAGGMAHEYNNLLVGVSWGVERLRCLAPDDAEGRNLLGIMERSCERAVELTRQLLAYARQGKYTPDVVSLNRAVEEDAAILKASLPPKVELRLDLADDVPPILADLLQFKQALMSLCMNALEAMPSGGILSLRTRTAVEPARGTAEGSGGGAVSVRAVLEVSDTGFGMDEAMATRIFEPFFTTKFIGRGMGLAAVRGIVENHGGEIRVSSEVGRGTTFTLFFPAASGDPPEPEARDAALPRATGTVLVADDEPDVRAVVRTMLESSGFRVIEAADGMEAVERFRERKEEIDLVLLDLMMPRMTGEEAFAEIRRISPSIRAILVSGYDESGRIKDIVTKGFGAFLHKPFRRNQLVMKVTELLGARTGEKEG